MIIKDINKYFQYLDNNKDIIYFDNAATSLLLNSVINAENEFNAKINSTSHSVHSQNGMVAVECINKLRRNIKKFINANADDEIVITSGTTFSLNTAIFGICKKLKKDDKIVSTVLEHASLIIPMIESKDRYKLQLDYLFLNSDGTICIEKIKDVVDEKTKLVAFASTSNTISSLNDVKKIILEIKRINPKIIVIVDIAQSVAHSKTDVIDWDADFVTFSAHKMYGPWGLGILYGKYDLLKQIDPIVYGGGAVYDNNLQTYSLLQPPSKFEAGTTNMASIYAFNYVFDFFEIISLKEIFDYEKKIKKYLIDQVLKNNLSEHFNFIGLDNDGPILSFTPKNISNHDFINFLFKKYKICLRAGKHCAVNSSYFSNIKNGTIRLSLALYNDEKQIDVFIEGLIKKDMWKEYIL